MAAVRELRAASGLTQPEFAQAIGRSLSTVQRYENIVPPTSLDTLALYARYARSIARLDLAHRFVDALVERLDPEFRALLVPRLVTEATTKDTIAPASPGALQSLLPLTPEEDEQAYRLICLLRSPARVSALAVQVNLLALEISDLARRQPGAVSKTETDKLHEVEQLYQKTQDVAGNPRIPRGRGKGMGNGPRRNPPSASR